MNIVIDARMLTWSGIGRYTSQLLEQLQQIDHKNRYSVLLSAADFADWTPQAPNFEKVLADIPPYSLVRQLRLTRLLGSLQPDLVHFTHFTVPLGYRGKYVLTIYDFTLVDYQNIRGSGPLKWLFYQPRYWAMRLMLRSSIRHAAEVITMADYTAGDIKRRYRRAGAIVTPGAAAVSLAKPTTPSGAQAVKPFLLYVGNAYPNKNLPRLIEAFALLGRPDYKLAIVGKADHFQQQLKGAAKVAGVSDRVIFPGFVSDGELTWLYQNAAAYAFPSLSEGFGLPGLEAMQCGLPVVSSNATCLPEVYSKAAHYFNPTDPHDMATKIGEVLDDIKLRTRLITEGHRHVKRFSWKRMAEQTLTVYEKMAP